MCLDLEEKCSEHACSEISAFSLEGRTLCRNHFLRTSYERLEEITGKLKRPGFDHEFAGGARRFLEDCMRQAVDAAGSPNMLDNLERAQVLDVLTWAAEIHRGLRRGPRVPRRIPIVVRLNSRERTWEEQTQTVMLSRHGLQVACRHPLDVNQVLTCVRLDNGWRTEARVVWTRPQAVGENEAGLEFLSDENFWHLSLSPAYA
jgi:hypothetical protein